MTRRTALGTAAAGLLAAAAGCVADRPTAAAGSEQSGAAKQDADRANATAAIKSVVDRFYELAKRRDWDAVGTLFAPSFRIFTDGAESFDKPAYVRLLKEEDIDTRAMKLNDLELFASPDGNMGWCRFRGAFDTASKGQASHVETAETLVFARGADGAWQIVHAHASVKTAGASS